MKTGVFNSVWRRDVAPPSDAVAQSLEMRRIRAMINMVPLTLISHFTVAAILFWVNRETPLVMWWMIWLALVLVSKTMSTIVWVRYRDARKFDISAGTVRGLVFTHAYLDGCLWAAAFLFYNIGQDPSSATAFGIAFAGVVMVSGILMAVLPQAVLMHLLPMAAAATFAHFYLPQPIYSPLALIEFFILGLVSATTAYFYARMFERNSFAITRAQHQGAMVSMLLSELERGGNEWVWEADSQGVLTRFPSDMTPENDQADPITFETLLSRSVTIKGAQYDELLKSLAERSVFHDILVTIDVGFGERWISFSGHPTHDEKDDFTGFVGTGRDVTAEKLAEERIDTLAHRDTLTGLLNRTAFSERLSQSIANLERYGRPFTVLYMDLDNFKLVNDTRGHLLGDRLLAEASERILDEVREGDCAARLNGDEFAILTDGQGDAGAAARLAARLIGEVSQPYNFEGEELRVGLSVGIALAPLNGTRPDQLLRNADLALYRAKADGRGVFRFFENDMDSNMRERRMLEAELGDAVNNEELRLHFQPLVDARTRQTRGMEALIRWEHPIRGLLSPVEFIELAEMSPLISQIGLWTIRKACETALTWPADTFVAVNLSAHHFMRSDIVSEVAQVMEETGLPPHRLELEITESLLIDNTDEVITKLDAIQALGVTVAMDDFGTGYSSLSYLMDVPFDKLKIDKSFVDKVENSHSGQKIVRMISNLAKEIELKVTAEGVETAAQADFLELIGCDLLQGYLFSRPIPEDEAALYFLKEMKSRSQMTENQTQNASTG